MKQDVFIVAARRTPVGGLMGSLSPFSAPQLGAIAIRDVYESAGVNADAVDEILMGHVLTANVGQAPARQAAIFAGIPASTDASAVNKVCASGMKAVIFGAQQIQLGLSDLVIAGGMESMSNAPHYQYIRKGHKYGHTALTDGMIKDGLWDVYNDFHMGNAAEICVRKYGITREEQDAYALSSYEKAVQATQNGKFSREIIPVTVPQKTGDVRVTEDEDIYKVIPAKVSKLPPAFEEGGTITAANASNLNDGAAALLLASEEAVKKYHLQPIARIISHADAAQEPEWFTTSPAVAIPKALQRAGLTMGDMDYAEINEAYASVVLANSRLLDMDLHHVNVYGGAVAIGHPIGASGARILCTLVSVLKQEGGKYGVAGICNGGGGASAIVIESM